MTLLRKNLGKAKKVNAKNSNVNNCSAKKSAAIRLEYFIKKNQSKDSKTLIKNQVWQGLAKLEKKSLVYLKQFSAQFPTDFGHVPTQCSNNQVMA